MTAILCNWLNNELKLSQTVDMINFTSVFSNGYLIGETLAKYNRQEDLDQFTRLNTMESRLNNFSRLEPSLHELGLHFDTDTARDIITEKYGAAINLMYELYVVLNRENKRYSVELSKGKTQTLQEARLTHVENKIYKEHMNLLVPRNTTQGASDEAPYFRSVQIQREGVAFKERFLTEETIKEKNKREQEILNERSRQLQLQQSEALAKLKASDYELYKKVPAVKHHSNAALRYKRKQLEIQETWQALEDFDAKLEWNSNILKLDTKKKIITSTDNYRAKISRRLAVDRKTREDLEKRRRKMLVCQQQAQDSMWLANRNRVLVNRILRQSQQEKKIVVQLLETRQQKNILMKNRMYQEKQYQERREKDFLDALNKEAELLLLAKEEYADQILKDISLHEKVKAERKAEKYQRHYELCYSILLQILDLTSKICEHRAVSSSLLPPKLLREWLTLFIEGKPFCFKQTCIIEQLSDDEIKQEEIRQALLDDQDFLEYKNMTHDWQLDQIQEKPKQNAVLAHVVNRLMTTLYPPPAPPEIPVFPKFNIRMCLLGKAYSGKSYCAEKLAEEYNLKVLHVDELIKDAIREYHNNKEFGSDSINTEGFRYLTRSASCIENIECKTDQDILTSCQPETKENERPPFRSILSNDHIEKGLEDKKLSSSDKIAKVQAMLGQKVVMQFEKGNMIPDNILVEIITEAIRNIKNKKGWILDGFPVTFSQTLALEEALTGIGAFDKPNDSMNFEQQLNMSQLLPNPHLVPTHIEKVSGFDMVIEIDIPDDLSLRRASGQYISERSKERFHMLHNPMTFGQATGIGDKERVVPLKTQSFDEENAQNRLVIYSSYWPKMEKWFYQFNNLYNVDGSQSPDDMYTEIKSLVDSFLQSKTEDKLSVRIEEEPSHVTSEMDSPTDVTMLGEEPGEKISVDIVNVKPDEGSAGHEDRTSEKPIEPDSPDWQFVDTELNMKMAKLLSYYWKLIEKTYLQNCKEMFRNIRREQECIEPYYFSIRKIFEEFLNRPDNKQEFVSDWQREYNSVPDDMRFDTETQMELHQTVIDLQDKLWSICDEQKRLAENECNSLITTGWYEDMLSKLSNSYITIMQAELDLFQDTILLLKDYYNIPDKMVLPTAELNFARLPLLESTQDNSPDTEMILPDVKSLRDRASSRTSPKQTKKGKDKEKEEEKVDVTEQIGISIHLKIPLINATAIRQSTATATEQKKFFKEGNEELTETAEKHIIEAFHHSYNQAHTEIDNIVAAEQAIRESEEEEERRKMQEKERERLHYEKIQKNKEKKSTKKGSTTKGKKEPEVTTPPPSFEISEEEKIQKNRREKLRREYYHAVETEEAAVKYRLEQIRRYAQTQVFASLQATAERTYRPIKECIGSRFLQQIESIDKMAEVMKNAIENGEKLKKELVLENEEFYINEEYLTQRISVEIIPEFTEQNSNQMTCVQLCAFLTQFQLSAPSGYISTKCFQEILEDLVFTSHGISALPKNWILPNLAQVQHNIQFLSKKVSNNTNLINWRQFIMWASYPFPLLSLTELHHLYLAYSNQDPNHTGYITYEIFNSVPFWSDEDIEKHNASYKFDRSSKLKDIFFDLFSEVNDCPIPIINYVNMLLYFCSMPFVFDGFKRAVILLCFGERVREEGLTEITSSELLIETKDNSKEATEVYVETAEEEVGIEISSTTGSQLVSEGEVDYSFKKIHSYPESRYTYNINQPIPIHIMLQALNHGVPPRNEYLENIDSDERVTLTELEEVYDCLGAKDGEPLPFESLMAHPLIQDTVSRSNNYRMMDIRNILYSASPVSSS